MAYVGAIRSVDRPDNGNDVGVSVTKSLSSARDNHSKINVKQYIYSTVYL